MSDWPSVTKLNHLPVRQAALAYAGAGLPVFPVYEVITTLGADGKPVTECACTRDICESPGKHPRIKGWREEASTDITQIQDWWHRWPTANIGMPTGAATGLVVVDLDMDESETEEGELIIHDGSTTFERWLDDALGEDFGGIAALKALEMRTGGGGRQLFFIDDTDNLIPSVPGWMYLVDTRGRDGLSVVPPSLHKSGQLYQWVNEHGPAEMPPRLREAMMSAKGTRQRIREAHLDNPGQVPAYSYAQTKEEGAVEGTRDDFFNKFAYAERVKGCSYEKTVAAAREIWDMTAGGGAPSHTGKSPFRWETAMEKINRVWETIVEDSEGRSLEPLADEMIALGVQIVDNSREETKRRMMTAPDPDEVEYGSMEAVAQMVLERQAQESQNGDSPRPEVPKAEDRSQPHMIKRIDGTPDISKEVATDLGNAARLGRVMGYKVKHVEGLGWMYWDGYLWQPQDLTNEHLWELITDIQNTAEKALGSEKDIWARWSLTSQSAGRISAMLGLAKTNSRIRLDIDELDSDPMILATRSGVLDMENRELVTKSPETKFCTRIAGVDYDPKATCPEWLRHVQRITAHADGSTDHDMMAFLQRWAGYTLTGLVSEQKFAFLYGSGANGKNVFVETLSMVMGGYAATASPQLLTGKGDEHPTMIASLSGPRLVFMDEAPKGKVNEARLKQLTGSAELTARKLYQNEFTFSARFKLWIAGNNKPNISDTSTGFWRRIDLIPFESYIAPEERIPDYAKLLYRTEGAGILNWALDGLESYQHLKLTSPNRINAARQEYREESDPMAQFLNDTFNLSSEVTKEWTPLPTIYDLYRQWCSENGISYPATTLGLGRMLANHGYSKGDRRPCEGYKGRQYGWIMPPLLQEPVKE